MPRHYMRPTYITMLAEPFEVASLTGFEKCDVPDDLMPLDAIRNLPREAPREAGLYFLWRGPQLLYIGYSADLGRRMDTHRRVRIGMCTGRKYPYTHYTCLERSISGLEALEYRYIQAYQPPFNDKTENTGHGRRVRYSDKSGEPHNTSKGEA